MVVWELRKALEQFAPNCEVRFRYYDRDYGMVRDMIRHVWKDQEGDIVILAEKNKVGADAD